MLVTRKRKKLLGFVCVWKCVIPENIHTSYTTDDFHILTPPPLPLPSSTQQEIECYQPKPKAEADNTYLDLDYSGYHKNLIQ